MHFKLRKINMVESLKSVDKNPVEYPLGFYNSIKFYDIIAVIFIIYTL